MDSELTHEPSLIEKRDYRGDVMCILPLNTRKSKDQQILSFYPGWGPALGY